MTELEQAGFDPRLEWGVEGAVALAGSCPVLVVVDVLRFTTAVEVAVAGGARVAPRPWPPAGAGRPLPRPEAAGPGPDPGPFSLSPVSLLGARPGTLVALASPNGAAVSLAAARAGAVVLAGCLRNASAVAAAAPGLGRPVGVVAAGERRGEGTGHPAAGERRDDGGLRPAVEDLLGAGAVLEALGGRPSPEARAAVAAFADAAPDLPAVLAACASGRELAARGQAADLPLAAEHDVSRVVPVLRDGAFVQLSWPG